MNDSYKNSVKNFYRNSRNEEFVSLNKNFSSLNSDTSTTSVSSIESLLESRRENPEEILLGLGFGGGGGQEQSNPFSRIPHRFFQQQSNAKGVHVTDLARMNNQIFFQNTSFENQPNPGRRKSSVQMSSEGNYNYFDTNKDSEKRYHHSSCDANACRNVDKTKDDKRKLNPKVLISVSTKIIDPFNSDKGNDDDVDDMNIDLMKNAEESSDTYYANYNNNLDIFESTSSSIVENQNQNTANTSSLNGRRKKTKNKINSDNDQSIMTVSVVDTNNLVVPHRQSSCSCIDGVLQQRKNDTDLVLNKDFQSISSINPDSLLSSSQNCQTSDNMDRNQNNTDQQKQQQPWYEYHQPLPSIDLISRILDVDVNSLFLLSSFIETSLLTSIRSLKLSLDFYRYFMFAGRQNQNNNSYGQSQPNKSLNQHLIFQNLYLEVLEIETMLHDCLYKFKNSTNWFVFISKYVNQLRNAMNKIFRIQLDLQKLCNKFSSTPDNNSNN